MAIRHSPGCNCCNDPPCDTIPIGLTSGTSFDTSNWSSTGTPTYIASDTIQISSETLTPLVSLGSPAAYYVQFEVKMSSGQIVFAQDTDTITWDFTDEDVQINAVAVSEFPTPDSGTWQKVNAYFCPTHGMGEIRIQDTVVKANPGGTGIIAGTTTIDENSPTVSTSWTIQAVGTAQIRNVVFYDADVDTDSYYITEDCGRRDLFPCHWPYWKDVTAPVYDYTTETVDLSHSGLDVTDSSLGWYDSTRSGVWAHTGNVEMTTTASEPMSQWDYFPSVPCSLRRSYRITKFDVAPAGGNWDIFGATTRYAGFGVILWYLLQADMGVEIIRPQPTQATPYPVPFARASIFSIDGFCTESFGIGSNPGEWHFDGTSTDIDLVDVTSGWTLSLVIGGRAFCTSLASTTITWTHP